MSVQALESEQERVSDRHDLYREVQYVMAALADELILSIDWPGRSTWPLLETQLFHSHASGEVFFKRLDDILRRPVTAFSDLEHIYLYALSLGFRGKYRDRDDHGQLAQYRQKLYLRIYQRPVRALIPEQQLFPQSYSFTLEEYSSRRMPGARIWILCLIVILGLWIAASDALWRNATAEVNTQIKQIQRNASQLDRTKQNASEDEAGRRGGNVQ
jgi:type VI secretion system protein ImpK